MKSLLALMLLTLSLQAQKVDPREGLWQAYDGEWLHVGQLVAYARVNGVVPPWSEGNKQ